ncbi:bifunctional adenosylcobinamide kinase/adenosylcobinamide-phosphate guanylyltransferase [Roseomonas sp. M0104]|uniref:Bifunctional adenosylcobalamin biosynthesis protein n=1 Tax=Teichococcus coralli TaxID=2545983 RepID=A0A845BDH4_9PROT|nr:bifunctional adenosylcobinamide kinase/adenosylcobinamide-phosphate guanylyltransferase [Pseudoroseomonas coralli]MXP64160.1 bifunctional adenosylcobinamide kinase/adenosylcobinamide-phosphate guanylyltransferase [Pseudoroseomonas coralli]
MPFTLVLGGARSGKSRHAEALIARHPAPWAYVATAEAWDDEMRDRIAAHQARRGADWRTLHAPLDLAAALGAAEARPALVDCLTLWLTNLMLGGHDVVAATAALEAALDARAAPTVLVANEVGLGIVPENALARRFRDAAGVLNQRLAARAATVHFIAAGLPLVLKGES